MGDKPRFMRDYSNQLTIDGKTYKSIADFCSVYGLRYSTVRYCLVKGKNADEILRDLRELPPVPKKVIKSSTKVLYRGVEYKSLLDACQKLGLKYYDVYRTKAIYLLTATEAIGKVYTWVYEHGPNPLRKKGNDRDGRRDIPCVVEGREFPSIRQACLEYDVTYATVMSRMQRNPRLSVEEAILYIGRRERFFQPVLGVSGQPIKFVPCEDDITVPAVVEGILTACRQSDYPATTYRDVTGAYWRVDVSVKSVAKQDWDTVSIVPHSDTPDFAYRLEFFLELFPVPTEQLADVLSAVNALNARYAGVTIYVDNSVIRVRDIYICPRRGFGIRQFTYALNEFVGTVRDISRKLSSISVQGMSSKPYRTQMKKQY